MVGASSDIGLAVAVDLAEQGWATVLWGRDRGRLQGTADLCGAHGPAGALDVVDVADRVGLRPALDRARGPTCSTSTSPPLPC